LSIVADAFFIREIFVGLYFIKCLSRKNAPNTVAQKTTNPNIEAQTKTSALTLDRLYNRQLREANASAMHTRNAQVCNRRSHGKRCRSSMESFIVSHASYDNARESQNGIAAAANASDQTKLDFATPI
jgi:hypothetical protein